MNYVFLLLYAHIPLIFIIWPPPLPVTSAISVFSLMRVWPTALFVLPSNCCGFPCLCHVDFLFFIFFAFAGGQMFDVICSMSDQFAAGYHSFNSYFLLLPYAPMSLLQFYCSSVLLYSVPLDWHNKHIVYLFDLYLHESHVWSFLPLFLNIP